MPTFRLNLGDSKTVDDGDANVEMLTKAAYDRFNASILGLGDIKRESVATDAVAAVFDLEGFTNFCKQIEPQLSVPLFLSQFLDWLLDDIKAEMTQKVLPTGALLWCDLPFFIKFMGDGLLVLWDSSKATEIERGNIVLSVSQICVHYRTRFLPKIRSKVVAAPPVLRCGLARGTVFSVGNGQDFVGSCINMAARLQKIPGLSFVFNRRGFDLEGPDASEFFKKEIAIKRVTVRGIGDDELIAILKTELAAMPPPERAQFRTP